MLSVSSCAAGGPADNVTTSPALMVYIDGEVAVTATDSSVISAL
jgi:hypothetical protein